MSWHQQIGPACTLPEHRCKRSDHCRACQCRAHRASRRVPAAAPTHESANPGHAGGAGTLGHPARGSLACAAAAAAGSSHICNMCRCLSARGWCKANASNSYTACEQQSVQPFTRSCRRQPSCTLQDSKQTRLICGGEVLKLFPVLPCVLCACDVAAVAAMAHVSADRHHAPPGGSAHRGHTPAEPSRAYSHRAAAPAV